MSSFGIWVALAYGTNYYACVSDEDTGLLYNPQFNWSYQKRGPASLRDQYGYFPLWPVSRISSGDPSVPGVVPIGMDICEGGQYEVSMFGESSIQRVLRFRGRCFDAGTNPVPGAVVQVFRTSDDLFVGQCVCDDGGYYDIGTPFSTDAHYLVAYKPGSPDIAGTTVNTLTPSL